MQQRTSSTSCASFPSELQSEAHAAAVLRASISELQHQLASCAAESLAVSEREARCAADAAALRQEVARVKRGAEEELLVSYASNVVNLRGACWYWGTEMGW